MYIYIYICVCVYVCICMYVITPRYGLEHVRITTMVDYKEKVKRYL